MVTCQGDGGWQAHPPPCGAGGNCSSWPFIYPIGCGKVAHPRDVNCPTTWSSSGDRDTEGGGVATGEALAPRAWFSGLTQRYLTRTPSDSCQEPGGWVTCPRAWRSLLHGEVAREAEWGWLAWHRWADRAHQAPTGRRTHALGQVLK